MSDRVFVDTNVFVYAEDRSEPSKQRRAREVLARELRTGRVVVSTQVTQEYFAVATRKLKQSPKDARRRVEQMNRLNVVVVRPELILSAIDLHQLRSISFWDALVIKAASVSGCSVLLSEDLTAGEVIDGIRVVNPFA